MGNSTSPLQQLGQRVLTTEQVRSVDRRAVERYGMHSLVLMENSGLGCVHWLRARFEGGATAKLPRTVILCGAGNNGGDGLVIARHLLAWGWPCELFVLGALEQLTGDAQANARILLENSHAAINWSAEPRSNVSLFSAIANAELIIDAMLGTGARGDPRYPLDEWIEHSNNTRATRIAIDVPTGVDAVTGQSGATSFRADATLTFVALKPAMVLAEAAARFGDIVVLPIGIPVALIDELLALDAE